jgi:Phospholipase B
VIGIDVPLLRGLSPHRLTFIAFFYPAGYTATHDRTDFLRQQCGYYSYNVIQDPFLAQISGQDELEKELGPLYSYAGTSRALIFAREMHVTSKPNDPSNKAIDLAAVQRVMRLNEFQTDPLSIAGMGCEGGARNSANAIASRYDLNKESSDNCDSGGQFAFGSIDSKVTSLQTAFPSLRWLAISGPTYEGQPVFAFSNSTIKDVPHRGLPDAWQFPWVTFSYPESN